MQLRMESSFTSIIFITRRKPPCKTVNRFTLEIQIKLLSVLFPLLIHLLFNYLFSYRVSYISIIGSLIGSITFIVVIILFFLRNASLDIVVLRLFIERERLFLGLLIVVCKFYCWWANKNDKILMWKYVVCELCDINVNYALLYCILYLTMRRDVFL